MAGRDLFRTAGRHRSLEGVKRAYDEGFQARKDGHPFTANPYRFSAWGLAGPWLVGWTKADRAIAGTPAEHPALPTERQRRVLLVLAEGGLLRLGAYLTRKAARMGSGEWPAAGIMVDLVDLEGVKAEWVHERTVDALFRYGLVFRPDSHPEEGRISPRGLSVLPEVRAVRWLSAKPYRGALLRRYTTPTVYRTLVSRLWVRPVPPHGHELTDLGKSVANRQS